MFKEINWDLYNKPPFLPGWMCKDETLKLAKIPDKQLKDFESNVYQIANQFDNDVIKNNTHLINKIGNLLGLERQGRNNQDYLQLVNLRKLLNINNSTVNDIIKILKLYYNNEVIEIVPDYPAGIHILHYGESKNKVDFNTFIKEVIGAGIQYATEEYYKFNENITIHESYKLKKYDVDEIHYNNEFMYNGLMQYGNMRKSRRDNYLKLNEIMNFTILQKDKE